MMLRELDEIGDIQIFGGTASAELATAVAAELGTVAIMPGSEFASGEVHCDLPESIRGTDTFVIQSHVAYERPNRRGEPERRSPQDALFEQMLIINAARSSWAGRVIAVSPFAGFGRQDRRTGRQAISSSLAFGMLKHAGADGMMAVDMHSPQAEGFFDGPFEHLTATPILVDHISNWFPGGDELVMVSPDNGRAKAVGRFRDYLGERAGMAVIDKRRESKGGGVAVTRILGDNVNGMDCVVFDDMIDGAGTIVAAAEAICEKGAKSVTALATHGLFSEPAAERLRESPIDRLIITDTVPVPSQILKQYHPKLEIVSVASFLADAIRATHLGTSIQELHGDIQQRI